MAKGDRWGRTSCHGCGREVLVLETKDGRGTYLCPNPECGHRAFFNNANREALRERGVLHTEEATPDGADEAEGRDDAGEPAEAGSGDDGDWWV